MHLFFFNASEVAEHFGVSTSLIYRVVRAGRIGYTRLGRTIRFSETDVAEFAQQRRSAPVGQDEA